MSTLPILPDYEKRNELKFPILPNVPYHKRLWIVLAIWVVGLVLQGFGFLLIGGGLIFVGTLFGIIRGHSNEPGQAESTETHWENVTLDEFRRITEIDAEAKQWDRSAWIDITNPMGLLAALGLAALIGLVALALAGYSRYLAGMCLVDGVALFAPFWITGIRRLYHRTELMIRVNALENILRRLEEPDGQSLLATPMLELEKTEKGQVPRDVKLLIRFDDAPDDFMGIQVQVSLNEVQGTKYPYLYCVILARPGFGLNRWQIPDKFNRSGIVTSKNTTDEVELIVVRQKTTKRSGYHTNPAAQLRVFVAAVVLCRMHLKGES